MNELPGKSAIITGASAGIGEVYARHLAGRGFDLILTARREERLRQLADELSESHGVKVEVVPADLTSAEDLDRLKQVVAATLNLEILINNAGFGVSGPYIEQSIDKHQRMIDLHITATVQLSHAALPGMIERKRGYIINVSSIAAWLPAGAGPGYCASKAYLNSFSTNLHSLVEEQGVKVQALCPGYTYTEFHNSGSYKGDEREKLPKWVWMTAEDVVSYSLEKLDSGKVLVIPGFKNRLTVFFLKSRISQSLMSLRRFLK
jgi:short-subunit dehydrogenase